jgi:hypothetical protein
MLPEVDRGLVRVVFEAIIQAMSCGFLLPAEAMVDFT